MFHSAKPCRYSKVTAAMIQQGVVAVITQVGNKTWHHPYGAGMLECKMVELRGHADFHQDFKGGQEKHSRIRILMVCPSEGYM